MGDRLHRFRDPSLTLTWSRLLQDFAAAVAAAEALVGSVEGDVDDGEEEPVLPVDHHWSPATEPPAAPPTGEESARFAELLARADACRGRLEKAMSAAANELDEARRRRAAARRYERPASGY